MALSAGTKLHQYEIVDAIGAGALGRFMTTSSGAPAREIHLVLNWLDEVELELAAAK